MKCQKCGFINKERAFIEQNNRNYCPVCDSEVKDVQIEFQRSVIREEYMENENSQGGVKN